MNRFIPSSLAWCTKPGRQSSSRPSSPVHCSPQKKHLRQNQHWLFPVALLPVLFLAGCASFSADGGFDLVASTVKARTGQQARWARSPEERLAMSSEVQRRLSLPITASDAAQISLLNNPTLQSFYASLGIAEADLVQASSLPNPGFSLKRLLMGQDPVRSNRR